MSYPDKARQTKGKYLPGDVLKMKNGSVGVVGEVNYNDGQEDPHYCRYSLERIKGFRLSFQSWWSEDEVIDAELGILHTPEKLERFKR